MYWNLTLVIFQRLFGRSIFAGHGLKTQTLYHKNSLLYFILQSKFVQPFSSYHYSVAHLAIITLY